MRKLFLLAVLALALAIAAGCSAGEDEAGEATLAARGAEAGSTVQGAATGAAEAAAGKNVAVSQPVPDGVSLPEFGPRVIQTAALRLSVPRNRFQDAVDEARTIAAGLGGFVVGSTSSQGSEGRLVRGTLVLRIPARSYAQAMQSLARLGRVEARDESGQDVSQEFVDLRSRTRHLQAVETQLLELLDKAETVAAALAVQSRLNQVQLELEQARGRLDYLDDQVSFSTISLAIHERGVQVKKDEDEEWSIVEAWRTAGRGFLAVVGWTFIALATAAPVVAFLALAILIGRFAYRRRIGPARA